MAQLPIVALTIALASACTAEQFAIQGVTLLRPTDSGLRADGPLDILITDGRIAACAPSISVPNGAHRLRGTERFLVPAPTISLKAMPDLTSAIIAAASGIGTIICPNDQQAVADLLARAQLETSPIPFLRIAGPDTHEAVSITTPTLRNLATASGGTAATLANIASSLASADPFAIGTEARFLLLKEDPRTSPDSILEPHAIIQADRTVLAAERLVKQDESRAGQAVTVDDTDLPPLPEANESKRTTRQFDLLIDGLRRGQAVLCVDEFESGKTRAIIVAHSAWPIEERFVATTTWINGEQMKLKAEQRVGSQRLVLERHTPNEFTIEYKHERADSVETSSHTIAAHDVVLPHTLLVLLDAAQLDARNAPVHSDALVYEVGLSDGGVREDTAQRLGLIAPSPKANLPLRPAIFRRRNAGSKASVIRTMNDDADDTDEGSSTSMVLLDAELLPRGLLYVTPWGTLEWQSKPALE